MLNRVLSGDLDHFEVGHVQFIAAGDARRAGVGFDSAGDSQAAFLGECAGEFERLRADIAFEHNRLADTAAIAHLQELEPAFACLAVEPAFQGYRLTHMFGHLPNRDYFVHRSVLCSGA